MHFGPTTQAAFALFMAAAVLGCDGVDSETRELARKHYAIPRTIDRIFELKITTREAADDLVPRLHRMPDLASLVVTGVVLREGELEEIGKLTQLTRLFILNGELGDEDLRYLTELNNITHLHLSNNPIRGPGLKYLAELDNIEVLDLANTSIGGQGIEYLKTLPRLRELRMNMTPLDDEGMSYIAKLPHLRRLDFGKTSVTELGFMKLVDSYWLVQPNFPDDIVGPDDDVKERMRLRRQMMVRFRDARLQALQEARARGLNVPGDDFIPFSSVSDEDISIKAYSERK